MQAREGHRHDCLAAAEQAWAARERSFERVPGDANALATPAASKPDHPSAAEWFEKNGAREADLALTARIRRALLDDASLSFAAKNVKILSRDGKVSLRGAVPIARERSAVRAIADRIAGSQNVEAHL
jgi:hyperosmotically inducible protein